jgi:DHA3 family tetracycline resistance protein-like MFS transporter
VKNAYSYKVYLRIEGALNLFSQMAWTVWTVYLVQVAHLDPFQLVLVGSVLEATAFLFEVPTGVVADTFSRRLSVIIGFFLTGAGIALTGATTNFAVILVAQVVAGIGFTFSSGAFQAWIADEVGEEHLPQVFLRATQVIRVGALAGILASVALGSIQLYLPLVMGGGLMIALAVYLVFVMPETGFKPTPRGERTTWQAMGHTFKEGLAAVRVQPRLLMFLAIAVFLGMTSEGFDRLGDAHLLTNFRFPDLAGLQPIVWFGVIDAGGMLLGIATAEIARRRLSLHKREVVVRALVVFTSLRIISVIGFAFVGSFWLALGFLWSRAVFVSLSRPLYDAWLTQSIDSRVRATVLSMSAQADAIGQIAGGPGIGWVGKSVSLRAAIALSGLLLTPVLALYTRAHRQGDSQPATELPAKDRVAVS